MQVFNSGSLDPSAIAESDGEFALENRQSRPFPRKSRSSSPVLRVNLLWVPTRLPRARALLLPVILFFLASGSHAFQSPAVKHRLSASLQNAAAKPADEPAPPVTFIQASSAEFDGKLVSITGALITQLHDTQSSTIILQSGGRLITGYLGHAIAMPKYPVGSVVRISGFCRLVPGDASRPAHLSYLEMRSPADLALIVRSSWFTLQHILYIVLALSTISLIFTIRAAFLKWQSVNRTAWIDRSMMVARERSRILEMISANRPLDESLAEICKAAEGLLPGAVCRHVLEIGSESSAVVTQPEDGAMPVERPLYAIPLEDEESKVHGSIAVFCEHPRSLAADREDIFKLLSELAAIALRQSLLYRGLVYHSTHDPLTELPNRRLFEERLADTIAEAQCKNAQLAVIYIDINRFKYVNDKFGHKTGDLYLQQISNRLRGQLRSVDTLARIGGDEFVVIAPFPEAFDRAYALTIRLEKCFSHPFELEGERIEGSASFGFARYPEHGTTAEQLTRHADHAMYLAKHEARLSEEAHALAIITPSELELALLRGRFRLAYQPQFSAAGQLTGMEALLRLDDPVLGIITPDAFISVAEKHPVIVDIGEWALRTALQDAIRWGMNNGPLVSVAVNVSVRQLEEPGYADSVMAILAEHNFPPERLEIELIERSLMFSGDKVTQQLMQLRAAGVRISLDDFGTEQSCLSLLHKLPIDTIKLDRSFIRAMDGEPGVLPIIQAIVSMAHSLGKRIVAEAIEHVGPVPNLVRMGKMDFQGFLLSRPVPADEVPTHIQRWGTGIEMPEAFAVPPRGGVKKRI
jgi:diguanylate cyclase (GGDEF)-like protein